MTNIGRDSARLLAGLQIDLFRKFRDNQVTVDHIEWFLGLTKEQRDYFTDMAKAEKLLTPNPMTAHVLSHKTHSIVLCVSLYNSKSEPRFIHVEVGGKDDDKITNFSWVRILGSCDLKDLWGHHPEEEKETITLSARLVRAIEGTDGYIAAVSTGYRANI